MFTQLSHDAILAIRNAAHCLTGYARRRFQAKLACEHCNASPRRAETLFGFNRRAVAKGLREMHTSKRERPDIETRGRPQAEQANHGIAKIADELLGENSQADPKFQTTLAYTRITGESFRIALAAELQIDLRDLPTPRTLRRVMNRRGYSLRKVRKTIPLKKIAKTDEIFANVKEAHQRAASDPSILRISIDNKAKVKIGDFCRIRSVSQSQRPTRR